MERPFDDTMVCGGLCDFKDISERAVLSGTVQCSMCNLTWHEECVRHTFPNDYISLISDWYCPTCIDDVGVRLLYVFYHSICDFAINTIIPIRLNEYILIPVGHAGIFYPCQIVDRISANEVQIKWFEGNIYAFSKQTKSLPEFITPLTCLEAYFRDTFSYEKVL